MVIKYWLLCINIYKSFLIYTIIDTQHFVTVCSEEAINFSLREYNSNHTLEVGEIFFIAKIIRQKYFNNER